MTKICIPIAEKTTKAVVEKMVVAKKSGADLVEIWLGEIKNPDIPKIVSSADTPIIVNCKGGKERGGFTGSDSKKIELLLSAVKAGVDYVDVDAKFYAGLEKVKNSASMWKEFQERKKDFTLILSTHYFSGTPGLPHLMTELSRTLELKPDVVKFVAFPKNLKDVVTMIRMAEKLTSKRIPHIVISMGDLGKITRLASPVLQNEIMFATIDKKSATAPGQIPAKELHKIYKIL